jgi:NDP-sugar pyrophosphorylase family protein
VATNIPKILVPVAGRPFLEWQLEWLARGGVRWIHLAAGHLAHVLAQWLHERAGLAPGVHLDPWQPVPVPLHPSGSAAHDAPQVLLVSMSVEPRPLDTGGGARFAASGLTAPHFLVVNGDSLLPRLCVQALDGVMALPSNPWMAMAVTQIPDATRFGTVQIREHRVVGFLEKGRAGPGWINAGVYAIRREALDSFPADCPLSLERDVFPAWAAAGQILAVPVDPPLYDIGTPEGWKELDAALKA